MKSQFTLFDCFQVFGPLAGAAVGVGVGGRFGVVAAVAGGVVGLLIGGFLGWLPTVVMVRRMHERFAGVSSAELRAELRRGECTYPNFTLLELGRRGEDVYSELPVVFDMLESEDEMQRRSGVAALTSVFPELAARVPGYRADEGVEECARRIRALKQERVSSRGGTIQINVAELRASMAEELARRCCAESAVSYGDKRGGPESLYGLTGAVNVCAALGLPLGDGATRNEWAARILSYRDANGHMVGPGKPGHALHMTLGALNLLGVPVPEGMGPPAPTDAGALPAWLERHDWNSTHKELCGQTIPLLASGRVSVDWIDTFVAHVAGRLDSDRPRETWCCGDDPAWRVISCMYHVLCAFDAGRIPYPEPERLLRRLLDLEWEEADVSDARTVCTDGDWAWLLLRLCEQIPTASGEAMAAIRRVSARRVQAWLDDREAVLTSDTHDLFCYCWVTGVFQSCVREHFVGGYVRDTLNDAALFRL